MLKKMKVSSWQSSVGSQQSSVFSRRSSVGGLQSAVLSQQSSVGGLQSAVGKGIKGAKEQGEIFVPSKTAHS